MIRPTATTHYKHTLAALLLLIAPGATAGDKPEGDAPPAPSAAATSAANPMQGFARLIGGAWHIGPLRHEFVWGVGQRTVIARTFDDKGQLASEARWFWHPGEKAIRGYSIDKSGAFFAEMTVRFDGDRLRNSLLAHNPDGSTGRFTGEWHFTGEDTYDWTLYQESDDGRKKTMTMTATRR